MVSPNIAGEQLNNSLLYGSIYKGVINSENAIKSSVRGGLQAVWQKIY